MTKVLGLEPKYLVVPEAVRQRAQAICDGHRCWECPLNERVLVWGFSDCMYLRGCLTGQCEICKENERTGRDTYKNPCRVCNP